MLCSHNTGYNILLAASSCTRDPKAHNASRKAFLKMKSQGILSAKSENQNRNSTVELAPIEAAGAIRGQKLIDAANIIKRDSCGLATSLLALE